MVSPPIMLGRSAALERVDHLGHMADPAVRLMTSPVAVTSCPAPARVLDGGAGRVVASQSMNGSVRVSALRTLLSGSLPA